MSNFKEILSKNRYAIYSYIGLAVSVSYIILIRKDIEHTFLSMFMLFYIATFMAFIIFPFIQIMSKNKIKLLTPKILIAVIYLFLMIESYANYIITPRVTSSEKVIDGIIGLITVVIMFLTVSIEFWRKEKDNEIIEKGKIIKEKKEEVKKESLGFRLNEKQKEIIGLSVVVLIRLIGISLIAFGSVLYLFSNFWVFFYGGDA